MAQPTIEDLKAITERWAKTRSEIQTRAEKTGLLILSSDREFLDAMQRFSAEMHQLFETLDPTFWADCSELMYLAKNNLPLRHRRG